MYKILAIDDQNDNLVTIKAILKMLLPEYRVLTAQSGIEGLKIAIDRTRLKELSPLRKEAFENTINTLKENGAVIIEDLEIKQTAKIYHVMKYEFKACINSYLAKEGLDIRLKDIVKYNQDDPKANLKYGQEVLLDVINSTSGRMNEVEYTEALKERDEATVVLNNLFKTNELDMIYFANYTSLGPHCGFPTLSLPIGLDEKGMPIGTYFLSNVFEEGKLIQIADFIEKKNKLNLNPLKKAA